MDTLSPTERSRFLSNIDRSGGPDACWPWSGSTLASGHGRLTAGPCKDALAHRLLWELERGPIPHGMVVRHTCDNPPCCNPDHLEVGTHAENRADCVKRNRHARGDAHGRRKLTQAQALQIRTASAGRTHAQIAADFGVSRSVVTKIRNGQIWSA